MAYIYTISHPITNVIVYVGCTDFFDKRKAGHINSIKPLTKVSEYIIQLRTNYLYPKIEIIDEVDNDELFFWELFWIRVVKSWGYDLLNVYKNKPVKYKIYKSSSSAYCHPSPTVRKSNIWEDGITLGTEYIIDKNKRNSFFTTFRHYNKKFGGLYYLIFTPIAENKLKATVIKVEDKPKLKGGYVKKGWPKRGSKVAIQFNALRVVGGTLVVKASTQSTSAGMVTFYLSDVPKPKRFKHERVSDTEIKITRIY